MVETSRQDFEPLMNGCGDIEEKVQTPYGNVKVTVYGDRRNKAIVTFHDLGLDAETSFQNFFLFGSGGYFTEHFCIYNINAPGQEMDSRPLYENFVYPTMDGLARIVQCCTEYFKLKSFIGLGVGLGANVLLRYALKNQSTVDALILVNCVITTAGWIEWGYQKVNAKYLRTSGMTSFTMDYMMWHHFGKQIQDYNADIVYQYRAYFQRLPNPVNLALLIECYLNRTALEFSRNPEETILDVPVLQIVGSGSPFIEETINVNSRLNPAKSEWMKIASSCGLVLDDKPQKVTQAILLFLQGLSYVPTLNVSKLIKQISESQSAEEAQFHQFVYLNEMDETKNL